MNPSCTDQHLRQSDYYTYDNIGQLTDVESDEPGGLELRENEMRTYEYDAAGNLASRNQDDSGQTFNVNSLDELTTVTRSVWVAVSGTTTSTATNVTVNGSQALLYSDNTFSKVPARIYDGTNVFTAIASFTWHLSTPADGSTHG